MNGKMGAQKRDRVELDAMAWTNNWDQLQIKVKKKSGPSDSWYDDIGPKQRTIYKEISADYVHRK